MEMTKKRNEEDDKIRFESTIDEGDGQRLLAAVEEQETQKKKEKKSTQKKIEN